MAFARKSLFRIALYLSVCLGAGLIIYGLLESQRHTKLLPGNEENTCVLWSSKWQESHPNEDHNKTSISRWDPFVLGKNLTSILDKDAVKSYPLPSHQIICTASMFTGVGQLGLCLLLIMATLVRATRGREGFSRFPVFEVGVSLIATLVSAVCAIVLCGGLFYFCHTMELSWDKPQSIYRDFPKPKKCSAIFLFLPTTKNSIYFPFFHLYLAQIGAWIIFVMWAIHTVISTCVCRANRNTKKTEDEYALLGPSEE